MAILQRCMFISNQSIQEYRTIDTRTKNQCYNSVGVPFYFYLNFVVRFCWRSIDFKMIESVTLPSIHTNGSYGKACESLENNNNSHNVRVKFPFQIQPVDPVTNQNLLRDFTGTHMK